MRRILFFHLICDGQTVSILLANVNNFQQAAGQVTNREVAARLQISARSASRLLTERTAQGRVRQMGERKGTYYILP